MFTNSNKNPDLRLKYDFLPATKKDLEKIVHICLTDFIRLEPHSRALTMGYNESRPFFEWLIGKSLHHPYSLKVVEKSTGRLVGVRAFSIGHRDPTLDWEPFDLKEKKIPEKIVRLGDVLEESKDLFWKVVDPSVEKVLRREVSFIVADHQRRGIAKTMSDHGLNYEKMRAIGIQGIVSEATSLANQILLQNSGFQCVAEPKKYDGAKEMDDGTTTVKVYFKDIRV